MLEKDIQRQIIDWLNWKKIFFYRNNSGAMISEYKGKKRFMRFGVTGSPDIVCVIKGQYVGIEVKNAVGRLTEGQEAFGKALEQAGGRYLVVRSLDEVMEKLKL